MDKELEKIIRLSDHKVLGVWAADVAKRVLPYFEKEFPCDRRPRQALDYIRNWVKNGVLKMSEVRKASLDAHAAARSADVDSPARFAARACGQAAAVAHVATHASGPIYYTIKCLQAAGIPESEIKNEITWAHRHLLNLSKKV